VAARLGSPRLGIGTPQSGVRTVVDYSAPNIAKEMHVGHLRTTIIGDALVRVLGFLGAEMIRHNHLGDWGTQFRMLIQYLDEHRDAVWHHEQLTADTSTVSALNDLYKAARRQFDAEPAFAERARARVVALQAGDSATVARWREIVDESELAFRQIYARLGVLLEPEDSLDEARRPLRMTSPELRCAEVSPAERRVVVRPALDRVVRACDAIAVPESYLVDGPADRVLIGPKEDVGNPLVKEKNEVQTAPPHVEPARTADRA
jgi:hypothetical protein